MQSNERAADFERLLARAAEECEALRGIRFGRGLPELLRSAIEANARVTREEPAELAFVEVTAVTPHGQATTSGDAPSFDCPLVGLSRVGLDGLSSLVVEGVETGIQLRLLICPVAVFDFTASGVRVREVRHGLTAADLQKQLSTPLYAGSDLKELGAH